MRRASHFSLLFISILALQLNGLGGGAACLLAASTGQMGGVNADMASMDMAAPTAPDSGQAPCHGSATPHTSCQSMTQCTAIVAIAQASREARIFSLHSDPMDLVTLVPPTRSLSPDVPPPKA